MTWSTLFQKINMYPHNYNRIDIAIDDFIKKLQKMIKQGRVSSKFKSSLDIIKRNISDGSTSGNTLQFGSNNIANQLINNANFVCLSKVFWLIIFPF